MSVGGQFVSHHWDARSLADPPTAALTAHEAKLLTCLVLSSRTKRHECYAWNPYGASIQTGVDGMLLDVCGIRQSSCSLIATDRGVMQWGSRRRGDNPALLVCQGWEQSLAAVALLSVKYVLHNTRSSQSACHQVLLTVSLRHRSLRAWKAVVFLSKFIYII